MLRRTVIAFALTLPLAGCVTYQIADRGNYYEVREGYGRAERHAWNDPRRGFYDPYDRWFYGWRGPGPAWSAHPWHGGRWYGSIRYGHGRSWGSSWGWSSPWGYSRWGSPWGGGWVQPIFIHVPRPQRPIEPIPMPKPFVRSMGPATVEPALIGPSIGGEAAWPAPRHQSRPQEARSRVLEAQTFDRRVEVQRFDSDAAKPRFEEPPSRFEEPPPRFEEPPPRFEEPPSRFEEPEPDWRDER